jgi:hypothetical protein
MRTPLLIALAAVIAVSVLVGLGTRAVLARSWCTSHPVVLHVAAAGEIAPVIARIGNYFNRQHRVVDGRCTRVAVSAASPGQVAAGLSGTGSVTGTAGQAAGLDAWVPDSLLWAELARSTSAGAARVHLTKISVAQTPLVIVMPRAAAARMPAYGTSVSWRFLLPAAAGGPPPGLGLHVRFPDPAQSGTGLSTLIELRQLFGHGGAARTQLATFVFHVQVVPAPAGESALTEFPSQGGSPGPAEPVTVIPEQEAITFDRAHPSEPLAVRYPSEGTAELTFPYVLTTTNRVARAVGEQFGKLLTSSYATSYLRYEGFRLGAAPIGSWPAWYGLSAAAPHLLPAQTVTRAARSLSAWHRLLLGSRDLALIDVSGAMAARAAPGGPTLEHMLARAAGLGLARFPDSTQMGLWAFASHLSGSLPYRQIVPLGPLPGQFGLVSRRQEIEQAAAASHALPGVPADLYGTILAAYRQMVVTYQPQYVNAVVVLTAGVDNAPGGISAAMLAHDLRAMADPARPVIVVIIMVGRSGNFRALQQIAAATGGQAAEITNPTQISKIFYLAMSRRLCQPHCAQ